MKIKIDDEEYEVIKFNSSLALWEVISTKERNKIKYMTMEQIKVLAEDD